MHTSGTTAIRHHAVVVRATLDKGGGRAGINSCVVMKDTPGFDVTHKEKKLGIRADDTAAFGWDPAPTTTDVDRDRLARADELTDALLVPAVETLSDVQIGAFAAGAAAMAAAVNG